MTWVKAVAAELVLLVWVFVFPAVYCLCLARMGKGRRDRWDTRYPR